MTFNPIKEMTFFLDFDNFFVFRVAFDPRVRKLPCMAIWMFEARFCREFNILAEQWTKRAREFRSRLQVLTGKKGPFPLYSRKSAFLPTCLA